MLIIPGFIISFLTFPGVIIHELAHLLFCKIGRVPVFAVSYFSVDMNVSGYVIHATPEKYSTNFLISTGPLFLNTLLCLLICVPASIPFYIFEDKNLLNYLILWLGVSIGMHSFPSNQDAKNLWEMAKQKKGSQLKILSMPIVGLVYLSNLLSFFWFDALYGFFIGVMVPQFVIQLLI